MNDKYFWEMCVKQLKTGTLLGIIVTLLVFSNQISSPTIASGKEGYPKYSTAFSDFQVQCSCSCSCSYSDYEIWACEDIFPNTLASVPLAELINAPVLLKLVVLPSNGEYDKDAAFKMINNLSKIQDNILRKLMVSGVKIKLINGMLTEEPEYAYLKGVTPRGYEGTGVTWDDLSGLGGCTNVVVKIGYSEKTAGTINLELHETGHAVDCVFNHISKSEPFLKVWKEEVVNLFSDSCNFDYVNNYAEEYFAEAFVMYFYSNEGKERLKEKAPLTYTLISQLALS